MKNLKISKHKIRNFKEIKNKKCKNHAKVSKTQDFGYFVCEEDFA